MSYRSGTTHAQRVATARNLRDRFPDRLCVIAQAGQGLALTRDRFLVPGNVQLHKLMLEIRRHVRLRKPSYDPCHLEDALEDLPAGQALFLLAGAKAVLVPMTVLMTQVYEAHVDDDGMLYITVCMESTFGLAS